MIDVSIIIPAYNEEQRISQTLRDYLIYFSSKKAEIIVVLNGCIDNTIDVVKTFQTQYPDLLKYIEISEAVGKGGAVQAGFKQAKGNIIGFVDADESTSPVEYDKLIHALPGNDGVIASRWLKKSIVKERTLLRKITSKLFVSLVKLFFNLPYHDTQCGAKVFTASAINKILPQLEVKNMAFDVELLIACRANDLKIKEVPTFWVDKTSSALLGSKIKLIKSAILMFKTLIKIRKKNYGQKSHL
ncbi:MAG: dolichyl-phosphate beta-glucosyltransferase [Patescibacteria group bacterium]